MLRSLVETKTAFDELYSHALDLVIETNDPYKLRELADTAALFYKQLEQWITVFTIIKDVIPQHKVLIDTTIEEYIQYKIKQQEYIAAFLKACSELPEDQQYDCYAYGILPEQQK